MPRPILQPLFFRPLADALTSCAGFFGRLRELLLRSHSLPFLTLIDTVFLLAVSLIRHCFLRQVSRTLVTMRFPVAIALIGLHLSAGRRDIRRSQETNPAKKSFEPQVEREASILVRQAFNKLIAVATGASITTASPLEGVRKMAAR